MNAGVSGNEIKVEDCYLYKESIKEIADRRYDAETKAWYVPLSDKNIKILQLLGAELDSKLSKLVKTRDEQVDEKVPLCKMPIRAEPYKHQVKAFSFALNVFGIEGGANG